jgi:hypothetical protein
VNTLIGMPSPCCAPLLVVNASVHTSHAPAWTVVGTRSGRLTRALGKPVSYSEAEAIAKAWSAPEQRAVFRDQVRAIPSAFDPCSVGPES